MYPKTHIHRLAVEINRDYRIELNGCRALNLGDVHRAIELLKTERFSQVQKYMEGWARDIVFETRCESAAAVDFERRAYG